MKAKTSFVVRITKYIDNVSSESRPEPIYIHRETIETTSWRAAKTQAHKLFQAQPIYQDIEDNWGKIGNWSNEYNATTKKATFWYRDETGKRSYNVRVILSVYLIEEEYRFGLGRVMSSLHSINKGLESLKESRSRLYYPEDEPLETHPSAYEEQINLLTQRAESLVADLDSLQSEYREHVKSLTNLEDTHAGR